MGNCEDGEGKGREEIREVRSLKDGKAGCDGTEYGNMEKRR